MFFTQHPYPYSQAGILFDAELLLQPVIDKTFASVPRNFVYQNRIRPQELQQVVGASVRLAHVRAISKIGTVPTVSLPAVPKDFSSQLGDVAVKTSPRVSICFQH